MCLSVTKLYIWVLCTAHSEFPFFVSQESDDEEEEETDPLANQRVHAWVLVRAGKRDVPEHFFVEPSTGRRYAVS